MSLSEQDVALAKTFVIGNGMYKLLKSLVKNGAYSEHLIEAKKLVALYEEASIQFELAKPVRRTRKPKSA